MRADRLVSLVLLLRQHERLSAAALARELEVSTRTVLRDMEALSTAGIPVYAERGRNGGFALLPGLRTELTGLTHDEALALLVAGSRSGARGFGLGSALSTAMLKVVDALPGSAREATGGAARRLLVDPERDLLSRRWRADEVPTEVMSEVRMSVLAGRRLRICYAALDQPARWRTVDPIGLVIVREEGYLLATRAGADRTYRLSRIQRAEALDEPAVRSDDVDLEALWAERGRRFRAAEGQVEVAVRVDRARRDDLADTAVTIVSERGVVDEAGAEQIHMIMTFQDRRHAVWALWMLGGDAEALSPDWLRTELRDRAQSLKTSYDSSPTG